MVSEDAEAGRPMFITSLSGQQPMSSWTAIVGRTLLWTRPRSYTFELVLSPKIASRTFVSSALRKDSLSSALQGYVKD